MYAESELLEIASKALAVAGPAEAEVILSCSEGALTRFGENRVTQNVVQGGASLTVRLLEEGRIGKASTGNLTEEGIARCVATAQSALRFSQPDPDLLPLVEPQSYSDKSTYHDRTFGYSPEERVVGVAEAVALCRESDLQAAGIYSSGGSTIAIANSRGLWACHRRTGATFSLSAMSDDSSGWAEATDPDVAALDVTDVARRAKDKALASRNPSRVEPGDWTVVLEPAAVADFLLFLAWDAFNGKSFVESRSAFTGKIGTKVAGTNVTIKDDAWHPLTPGNPFDYEGMPRQTVPLIENGVFMGVVHDRTTGAKAGTGSTGHALPQPDSNGPLPLNMVLEGGESSLEEMIASTDRGLLVTRLHYTNLLDPMKVTITGMTRDGLFLIEGGKVTRGLKNMRFTLSVLDVLNSVEALSRQLYRTETFWGGGGTVAPAIKVSNWTFTSGTEN
ncbi:MAG: TldD/PmbA family protein [Calditrichaeota bacterium]|nr:TldD/PmbA family protein [Calditrichota bacterium]